MNDMGGNKRPPMAEAETGPSNYLFFSAPSCFREQNIL